ncbi:hypothetical protein [Lacipirellula parvula]|uniref:Uncharacterized protein n=1 Tax=Lacipirellula parvula TaxID=2650471 RepID=A0A5K7X6C9_9BACT|nr:hypothetical protein [Lacipirellula parvula]BBO32130.1 hypothetical protein PLANPX_1742 [Lacipirellula parvula]
MAKPQAAQLQPWVDGSCVVIPTQTALPQRCIITNEPVESSEYQVWNLPYIPRWLLMLMFMGPFFMITAPFVRQRCKFKAGFSRRYRRRRLVWRSLLISILPMSIVMAGVAVATGRGEFLVLAVSCLVISCMLMPLLIIYAHPMRVVRHYDGLYWISGMSPAFLAGLEAMDSASTTPASPAASGQARM